MSSKLSQQFVSPRLFWLDSAEDLMSHPAIALAPHRLWQSILPIKQRNYLGFAVKLEASHSAVFG